MDGSQFLSSDIPQDLRALPQWVCWQFKDIPNKKKPAKPVFDPHTGIEGSSTDPETWGTFEQACIAMTRYGMTGIGFVFAAEKTNTWVAGVDLDGVRQSDTGEIDPWAQDIVDRLSSYTEVSPSGTGLHTIVYAKLPPGGRKKPQIEMYDSARYFTMTGNHLPGTPKTVEHRQAEIEALHREYFGIKKPEGAGQSKRPISMSDGQLLDVMFRAKNGQRIRALWDGDASGYSSHSNADFALMSFLASYTCCDPSRMAQMFQSSGLYRESGKHRGYVSHTVEKAVSNCDWFYDPGYRSRTNEKSKRMEAPSHTYTDVDLIGRADKESDGQNSRDSQRSARQTQILVSHDITRFVDQGIEALVHQNDNLFQRDGILVSVHEIYRKARTEHDGNPVVPRITVTSDNYIQELANRAASWFKPDERYKDGYKQIQAPMPFVRFMKGRPSLPFPVLTAVTTAPTIRRDGSVIETPGYDDSTGLYYYPARQYPKVPDNLTWDDARAAYTNLCEVFEDFPFVADCHMSVAIAAVLSICCRHLLKTVPMFPVRSNVAGSGKGLLVSVASMIATGHDAAFWDQVTDPEEERKRLLVIAMDGDRVTCLDNLTQPLGSAPLDRAITQATAKGRILGLSKNTEAELTTVFFATGNNMTFAGDMARRVVPIDMSPNVEHPEARDDFKHPDLLDWVTQKHPKLLVSALTILKSYIQAGKPNQSVSQYGSFVEWSNLVRSALVWLDAADPCEAREGIQAENDQAYDDLRALMHAWRACYDKAESKRLLDVFDHIKYGIQNAREREDHDDLHKWSELETALDAYCKYPGENPTSKAKGISRQLPTTKTGSRIIDGMRIVVSKDNHSKTQEYRVIDA